MFVVKYDQDKVMGKPVCICCSGIWCMEM